MSHFNAILSEITVPDLFGYAAAIMVFATFYMRTMVPLRLVGIASNFFFIIYGYLASAHPPLVLHLVLLPLNIVRLVEMLRLTKQVQTAAAGKLNMSWLRPFMSTRKTTAGEMLFRKGDTADCLYVVVNGRFQLAESQTEMMPGSVVGELGLLSQDRTRTQSLECIEDGELLRITYDQVNQLYFQNPNFGFYFLQLTTRRLFQNVARLESENAALRQKLADAGYSGGPR